MKSVVLLLGSLLVTDRSGFAQATNNLLSVYAPINYAPVADPQRITLVSLKPIVLVLKGYDANGDSLSFNIVTQPSEGILSLFDPASGLVTYTPPSQVFGADSFTFSVTDGIATSGTVTVALVSPVAVPSVIGMTKAEATTAITDAGLMVGIVTTATSVTVPAGSVISEYPTAAALTNPGSAVNLLVSGPANNRSFVATTGNDANNCTESAYCRTLAAALTVTNPGGEIIVVTSGGWACYDHSACDHHCQRR